MKGVPKLTVKADRPTPAGVRPPSPDRHEAPFSARVEQRRDATGSVTTGAELDRGRRLAKADPQGRYGNSEVARVALQQNPPPPGSRRIAARRLPEAGPLARSTKKPGGHGKPSAHPGAAKAAVEAKHKAEAQGAAARKQEKKAPAKEKAPPKAGAVDKREQPAAEGKDKDEGASAREAGAADAAAEASRRPAEGAGGGIYQEESPPQRPRLEGTDAAVLSMPPLNDQQRERIRSQTGFTIGEHYARVQVHLDRLSSYARNEQFAIVVHIELLEAEVRRDLDNTAALIKPAVGAGIDRVRGACAAARADITNTSGEALKAIEKHFNTEDRKADFTALSSKEAVEKAVAATSPQLRKLYDETMEPLRTVLKDTGKAFVQKGKDQGEEMVKAGKKIGDDFEKLSGNPIQIATNEKKAQAAADQAKEAQKDLQAAGERGQTDILAQEPTLGMSFLMLVNPVAVKVEQVAAADGQKAVEKGGEMRLRLATDYERAKGYVEETAKRALKALDALERSAVKQLEQIGRSLEEMARARRQQLCNSILEGQGPAADAWPQQMAAVNELVPPEQVVDWRRLEPRFVAALDSMHALSMRQRLDLDAQARTGFDEARAGLDDDRRNLEEAADSYLASAQDTRKQAAGLRQMAETFGDGFRAVIARAAWTYGGFREKAEEKLGLSVADTRKQMADLLKKTKKSMGEAVTTFDSRLGEHVGKLATLLQPTFASLEQTVYDDIQRRAKECVGAMDRPGTQETRLFEALYGMTPKYGQALAYYWVATDHGGHKHDLWWWLEDELSGDEYWTAYYYLSGDPVKGAEYQLKASQHWYGNDVAQMESGLKALTPDQIDTLNNDKDFTEKRKELVGELKGTNLQVIEAYLANRPARAEALRLKEKIDAARAAGDDDKLHDLLAEIDPKRLPKVRSEFVDIIEGHAMTATPPVSPSDEAALDRENRAFTKYITDPVEAYEPGMGEDDPGRWVTRTLSDPSKKLAEALATTGEGSPESRAARLAYEHARGGKPRPDRLAKALDDPELTAARNNPILKQPNADPQQLAQAKEVRDRLEARRLEMMKNFVELQVKDQKVKEELKNDPKRAQEYTEKAVADMFGEDELGRELGTSMVHDGRANPAVAIKYAVRGRGTNEELIRKTLRGMSREEIEALKKDYAKRYGGPKENPNALFDDLGVYQNADTAAAAGVEHATGGGFFTELSGDDRQEVEELLLGTPENDRDRWRLARLKYAHQKGEGSTWVTGLVMDAAEPQALSPLGVAAEDAPPGAFASRSLDMNKARMEEMVEAAGGEREAFDEKGNFKDKSGRFSKDDFRLHVAGTMEMAENYKHHVDSIIDMITTAIAIIGAIVGTIVVTVLTLGTATPLVVGLWAAGIAAATGGAIMATKYALKGNRYGWEEAAVDGAMTLVDAATAGLMAGAGAKAARAAAELAALKSAARTPAQEAVAEGLIKQHARKELARGFVRAAAGAGVGGTARTAMTDGTWDEGVLTGLGRSVSGGARAAVVGVATHGASQGFARSGVGQRLGQSTSYLGRGLGSGVGGALAGMAGRATDLSLDALGGHAQGPWYDALGDIALAGGRGFAENFGQGMAEVPKARRDAVQARLNQLQKMSDAERVARYGTNAADETGDLRFRRMAVAAALAHDPRTNPKAFLADLDASVAQDRSVVEANRRLVREFRREALAAIPKERRGEFADVPIRIVPDAEFERFTGSQSARAVTLIVDGEAEIVVRRSATPDALREEGIHALQLRDPRWRDRMVRLDEQTMARWDELDLDTQLMLYREKIEIEIDAQQRLKQNLLDEVERTPDPARRKALQDRVEQSEDTLKELQKRRVDVDAIGPERRAAIRKGDEKRPQYLREPARLFTKARPLELQPQKGRERAAPLKHDSEELATEPRRSVDIRNSTWEKEYSGLDHRLYQVGDAWTEWEPHPTKPGAQRKRWYRMVEVTALVDGVETVVDRRREILGLGPKGRWRQRGSESTAWGTLFEEASRQRTLETVRQKLARYRKLTGQRLGDDFRPDEDPLVPIGALTKETDPQKHTPLTAQHGGGAGFDDIVFRFRKVNGVLEAEIIIIEAKGHVRSLTLEDFSAIAHNLPQNLEKLALAIDSATNLSQARKNAIFAAIDKGRLRFELHRGPDAQIGEMGAPNATILNDIVRTQKARRQIEATFEHLLNLDAKSLSKAERQQANDDLLRLARLQERLERAYAAEPFRPENVRTVLRAILDGREKVSTIAKRNGLPDVEGPAPVIRRDTILDRKRAEDQIYFERARIKLEEGKKNFERSAGFALGLAERAKWIDHTFVPQKTAATEPKDIVVVESSAKKARALAVTRPSVTGATAGVKSPAADQLVNLLRDGVVLDDGRRVHPDPVVWDTAGASAAQVVVILEQVQLELVAQSIDPTRLRVMIDGAAATDADMLRKALKLPDNVTITPVKRDPHNRREWVLEFTPAWLTAAAST